MTKVLIWPFPTQQPANHGIGRIVHAQLSRVEFQVFSKLFVGFIMLSRVAARTSRDYIRHRITTTARGRYLVLPMKQLNIRASTIRARMIILIQDRLPLRLGQVGNKPAFSVAINTAEIIDFASIGLSIVFLIALNILAILAVILSGRAENRSFAILGLIILLSILFRSIVVFPVSSIHFSSVLFPEIIRISSEMVIALSAKSISIMNLVLFTLCTIYVCQRSILNLSIAGLAIAISFIWLLFSTSLAGYYSSFSHRRYFCACTTILLPGEHGVNP